MPIPRLPATASDTEIGDALLDAIRERKPPASPDACVEEFVTPLKRYGVRTVTGDRYGGEWPRVRFRELGVGYAVAEQPKSVRARPCRPPHDDRDLWSMAPNAAVGCPRRFDAVLGTAMQPDATAITEKTA